MMFSKFSSQSRFNTSKLHWQTNSNLGSPNVKIDISSIKQFKSPHLNYQPFRSFSDQFVDHKQVFTQLAAQNKIDKPESWFKQNVTELTKQNEDLLKQYGNSLFVALSSVYPEHINIWKDRRNHRAYFEQLAKQLNLSNPDEWYKVKLPDFQAVADTGLLKQHYGSSVIKALEDVYPERSWKFDDFDPSVKAIDEAKPRRKKAEPEAKQGTTKEKPKLPDLPASGIAYTIRRGKARGVPTCRGCRRAFEDKSELRVQTTLLYEAPGLEPRPVQVNFCINQFCIQQALKNYRKKDSVIYPFDGRVEVPTDIPRNEIPQVEGLTWVFSS